MTGYELTTETFASLIEVASRHHREQIADWLCLTAHIRHGSVLFRDQDGAEVLLEEVHRRAQVDAQIRRLVYNLFMHYAHIGGQ